MCMTWRPNPRSERPDRPIVLILCAYLQITHPLRRVLLNKEQEVTPQRLVDALGRRHGSLDGEGPNVLPSLLQQRDEVVNGQHDVTDQLILSHANVSDSDTHAQHLLELELDGALDVGHLVVEVFGVGHWGGELAGLGETGAEETGNLLDEGVGGDKGVVLASKLLDELLVLVAADAG
jgi:hypothetical protein